VKKVLFVVFMLTSLAASAQEFKPFKVNLSLGYAKPSGGGASGGVLFSVEPKYGLNDNIDLGLRVESALVARGVTVSGESATGDVAAIGSGVLTGNYYFSTGGFRPFVGVGLGLFSIASAGVLTVDNGQTEENVTFSGATKFGGMVRAGFKAGHFVLGVEYNAISASDGLSISSSANASTISIKNSYLGVKLGFDIGGGRY